MDYNTIREHKDSQTILENRRRVRNEKKNEMS